MQYQHSEIPVLVLSSDTSSLSLSLLAAWPQTTAFVQPILKRSRCKGLSNSCGRLLHSLLLLSARNYFLMLKIFYYAVSSLSATYTPFAVHYSPFPLSIPVRHSRSLACPCFLFPKPKLVRDNKRSSLNNLFSLFEI